MNNQDELIYRVNLEAEKAKEEIHSVFLSHFNALRAREQWLSSQVDNIKSAMLASVLKYGTEKARVEQYEKILECIGETSDQNSIKVLNEMIESLNLDFVDKVPEINFVHNKALLQMGIKSYGKVSSSTEDVEIYEKDSEDSEWDVVNEDHDEEQETDKNGLRHCNHYVSFGNHDKNLVEIEDMDVSLLISKSKCVSDFCQANEVCNDVKECLFDEPCNITHAKNYGEIDENPVSHIQRYFHTLNVSPLHALKHDESKLDVPISLSASNVSGTYTNKYVSQIQDAFKMLNSSSSIMGFSKSPAPLPSMELNEDKPVAESVQRVKNIFLEIIAKDVESSSNQKNLENQDESHDSVSKYLSCISTRKFASQSETNISPTGRPTFSKVNSEFIPSFEFNAIKSVTEVQNAFQNIIAGTGISAETNLKCTNAAENESRLSFVSAKQWEIRKSKPAFQKKSLGLYDLNWDNEYEKQDCCKVDEFSSIQFQDDPVESDVVLKLKAVFNSLNSSV